jgi:4-alpha-glucanotransferase
MDWQRRSGVLLHPTSFAGPYGIGDLGPMAYDWVDRLVRARQTWWQMLPLGPTGYGDSPYQSFSSFAGNIQILSPELMAREGLISLHDLPTHFPRERVDFEQVIPFKKNLLHQAWQNFSHGQGTHLRVDFDTFRHHEAWWLDDFCLFMAIRDSRGGQPWYEWPADLRERQANGAGLQAAQAELADAIGEYQFGQFLFFHQWDALRRYAKEKGIKLIGDVPIFVAGDSSDVWGSPDLYQLDEHQRPQFVAGVPPDYFAATGQLWGNPVYAWERHQQTGYRWWINRLKAVLRMVDIVRLDHFRGFCAAWHVPAGEKTAERGEWIPGPAGDFFHKVKQDLGSLPLIAEDLGEITPDVFALRDELHLPGMKVLQFAFDGPKNIFLPHQYIRNCIVYTGTHDNDTTRGWFATAPESERDFFRRYSGRDGHDISWDLIRMGWSSVADTAIAPLQDILDLDTTARMNLPGTGEGNWRWRMQEGSFDDHQIGQLAETTAVYDRTT